MAGSASERLGGPRPDREVAQHLRGDVDRIVERGERRQRHLEAASVSVAEPRNVEAEPVAEIEREALDGARIGDDARAVHRRLERAPAVRRCRPALPASRPRSRPRGAAAPSSPHSRPRARRCASLPRSCARWLRPGCMIDDRLADARARAAPARGISAGGGSARRTAPRPACRRHRSARRGNPRPSGRLRCRSRCRTRRRAPWRGTPCA